MQFLCPNLNAKGINLIGKPRIISKNFTLWISGRIFSSISKSDDESISTIGFIKLLVDATVCSTSISTLELLAESLYAPVTSFLRGFSKKTSDWPGDFELSIMGITSPSPDASAVSCGSTFQSSSIWCLFPSGGNKFVAISWKRKEFSSFSLSVKLGLAIE